MKRRLARADSGYTLIELIISMTLLALITGALVAAFITTNDANANTSERIHESNDAQLTAGFWTADAQAAGGVDPTLGARDTALGVLASDDDGGCTVSGGTKVIGFKWKEWSSRDAAGNDSFTTRVANYVYVASSNELQRRTCANNASTGSITLATRVASAPTISCAPSTGCPSTGPPGLPSTVTITVTETNDPSTGPAAYQFSLTATVRSDDQTTPDSINSAGSPLLVLGGSCTAGYGFSLHGSNGMDIVINGDAVINATDGAGCTAMSCSGNPPFDAGTVTIATGGSASSHCPGYANGTVSGNPFSSLAVPSTAGCGSGTNPSPVNGHWPATTYPQTVTLAEGQVFDPGTVVLCNGLAGGSSTRSTGVFIYVAGGSITASTLFLGAPTSGTYAHVALWNATSNDWNVHQDTVNIIGAYYSPNASLVNANGVTSVTIGVIVAKGLDFGGSSGLTVTGTGTPGSPVLTAATSATVLREVNLTWTTSGFFQGISPITDYEMRANRGGAGWSTWSSVGTTQPVRDVCGSSSTITTSCDYQVRAVNAQGPGSPSNIATASSLADGVAPAVTVTAPNGPTTLSTTFSGAAGNVAGDLPTINVSLYDGPTCIGTPIQTYVPVTSTGATWTLASGALTPGTKCVLATQTDTAGNVGSAQAVFAAGLQVANGGTAGKADRSDTITITYPRAVNESTLCNTWTTNVNQSIAGNNVVTATITDGGSGNDVLTVSTSSGCTFNLGSIDLGSAAWVNATTTYKGTGGNVSSLAFTAATNTLKITLGTGSGSGANVATQTMTYTPSAAIKDTVGGAFTTDYAGKSFVGERF
jgi:prepilin-type N-terminal cleavage/methylation domain-containing protein